MSEYRKPLLILLLFEAIAVTLWLTKNNIFYLWNFSYIGCSLALACDYLVMSEKSYLMLPFTKIGLRGDFSHTRPAFDSA